MCRALRIFRPTHGRLAVFVFLAAVTLASVAVGFRQLYCFFGLPLVFIPDMFSAMAVQLVYSYILACIYAAAYVAIERAIRPHMRYDWDPKKRKVVRVRKPSASHK